MARKGENIFKRKDGRWEGRYIKGHKDGKAVYGFVFGKSYSEARNKKAVAMAELAAGKTGGDKPANQPTMRELGNRWLAELEPIRKKSTVVKYEKQLDKHIYPVFGETRISEISNEDVIAFGNELVSEKCLSPKSAVDIIARMKSIRRFALVHGCEVNFMSECVVIPQKKEGIRVLSFSEEELLFGYLDEHPDLTSLGILVCLFTGIRLGELCALKWSDISLDERELHVCRTMQRLQSRKKDAEHKTYIEIGVPKSECSVRTIPIPDNIIPPLRSAYAEGAYLLTGQGGRFVEPRTMENRFKAILKSCGIADANFHALCHTFATRCVEAGFDAKSLSEILGHASVGITLNRYVHPTMKLKRENMDKLSRLFAVK